MACALEDCGEINGWNPARRAQVLAVRMRGAALLQLQSIPATERANYDNLKAAFRLKFVPQERIELHKAKFRARRREKDEKNSDLSNSLRRLSRKAYPEAANELQDSLAKDQFIDALEDWEIRLKFRESGAKTLDEAVSRALQIKVMYEAESRRGKSRSVRLVQEPPPEEKDKLLELIKQNTAAMNQMVAVVQQQQPSTSKDRNETKQNGRGLGPNAGRARDLRLQLCFKCHCKQTSTGSGNQS